MNIKPANSFIAAHPTIETERRNPGTVVAVRGSVVDVRFDGHALGPEGGGEAHSLGKAHVAIVVTLDEQNGRAPSVHGGKR